MATFEQKAKHAEGWAHFDRKGERKRKGWTLFEQMSEQNLKIGNFIER